MIEVQGLAKRFGTVQAVTDASFTAADGKITGLLGPNGAGKSTTLRMLYTAITPDAGRAAIGGVDVIQKPHQARSLIGVLPHNAGLYGQLTARENIEYYGSMQGLSGSPLNERVQGLIDALGMGEFADRRTKGFSQGQKTKVALARALVHDPGHVILDEPTNGLDVMATRSLREYIRGLRDAGKCVILSSHIMQEVTSLCDEIVVIAKGRVVAAAPPAELLRQTGETELEEAFIRLVTVEEKS
ncbi:MAG: ATP-binding cassette domain-containing protein [Myxococcota bacterium]